MTRSNNQAKNDSSIRLKVRLIERGLTVTGLASELRRPRPTVSAAIHQHKFPRVRKQIEEFLHV